MIDILAYAGQSGVVAICLQEFFMLPCFHQLAVFQHDNLVGMSDGREAVGDDYGRPVDGKLLNGLLDQLL